MYGLKPVPFICEGIQGLEGSCSLQMNAAKAAFVVLFWGRVIGPTEVRPCYKASY